MQPQAARRIHTAHQPLCATYTGPGRTSNTSVLSTRSVGARARSPTQRAALKSHWTDPGTVVAKRYLIFVDSPCLESKGVKSALCNQGRSHTEGFVRPVLERANDTVPACTCGHVVESLESENVRAPQRVLGTSAYPEVLSNKTSPLRYSNNDLICGCNQSACGCAPPPMQRATP